MTDTISSPSRLKRTLLASAFVIAATGGVATTGMFTPADQALAEAVRIENPTAPADFRAVVREVAPAVVSVRVKVDAQPASDRGAPFRGFDNLPEDHPLNRFFRRPDGRDFGNRQQSPQRRFETGQGSGFFISEDGYLVTNDHVVADGSQFTVSMDDGTEYDAQLIGTDERTDLALLKVDADRSFTYVQFAEQPAEVGEWVVAVGNPFGLGGTVTAGIVSASGRAIGAGPYDYIQIDAPVNRGNSGGPAFNLRGEVIGINTAIFSPSGGNVGIAFAVPAATAAEVITDLRDDGKVVRGWLGVQIQPVTADLAEGLGIETTDGALVNDPQPGGPAEKAGIRAGDVILEVDGESIKDPRQLARVIAAYAPGAKVKVLVLRDGEETTIDVDLGLFGEQAALDESDDSQPSVEPSAIDDFGLALMPSEDGTGVLVGGVESDSVADEKGLEAGDRIISVAGSGVNNVRDVTDRIAAVKKSGRKAVLMQVERDGGARFVALPFGRG